MLVSPVRDEERYDQGILPLRPIDDNPSGYEHYPDGGRIAYHSKSRNSRVLAIRMVKQHLIERVSTPGLFAAKNYQTNTITNSHLHHQVLGLMVSHTFPGGGADPLEVIDTKLQRQSCRESNSLCGNTNLNVMTLHDSRVRFRLHQPTGHWRRWRHDRKLGRGCQTGDRDRDRVVVICLATRELR